jgi:hypothetical protein
MTARLCLNMIVRNEMQNLERCLTALAGHVDCWVIGDTLSTDGTQDMIRSFFAARDMPGELHSFPFRNFEQARNQPLDCAYHRGIGVRRASALGSVTERRSSGRQ